jgi:hypothetical protein
MWVQFGQPRRVTAILDYLVDTAQRETALLAEPQIVRTDRSAAPRCRRHDARSTVSSPTLAGVPVVVMSATLDAVTPQSKASGHCRKVRNPRSDNQKQAPLAQSAERLHGKEKVYGSIP